IAGREYGSMSGGWCPAFSDSTYVNLTVIADREGLLTVRWPVHVDVYFPWSTPVARNQLCWSHDWLQEGQVQVLPKGKDSVTTIDDPHLADAIKQIIHVEGVYRFNR